MLNFPMTIQVPFTGNPGETIDVIVSEEIALAALRHGLKQKINDAHAGESDVEASRSKAEAVAAKINAGIWTTGGGGGDRLAPWEGSYREDVAAWLITQGVVTKRADAAKTAKSDNDVIERVLEHLRANGADMGEPGDAVAKIVAKLESKWKEAQTRFESAKTGGLLD